MLRSNDPRAPAFTALLQQYEDTTTALRGNEWIPGPNGIPAVVERRAQLLAEEAAGKDVSLEKKALDIEEQTAKDTYQALLATADALAKSDFQTDHFRAHVGNDALMLGIKQRALAEWLVDKALGEL